jgi:tRNA1(Val) A37 N6-methylase TrmN6
VTRTDDRLLDGRVRLAQPASGYRVAIDPVLLAAAVPVRSGQRALDLGCGVGAASLCLLARVPDLSVVGVELDPTMARLAEENGVANGHGADRFQAQCGDIGALQDLATDFDQVLMNPPFHDPSATPSPIEARTKATHARDDLVVWTEAAHRRLKRRGGLTLIWPASRLSHALAALSERFGAIALAPIWPRQGAPAKRVLIHAVKGARAPDAVKPGLVLHGEGNGYTETARAILWDAAAFEWESGS